ncbi:GIY-YIG nuclease family protein [Candidatus Gracilibacteria bacterium]|nr:GIY-YIG nuclease family protein [Candidatus Gracilibacteria bacterium]
MRSRGVVKGSYILVFQLDRPLNAIAIGRLGCFDFVPGYYIYIGSAFGSGGLPARLAYHQRRYKAHPHWHIDYLRPFLNLCEIWTVGGPHRLECSWCELFAANPALQRPVAGFGSRDTGCASHLFFSARRPSLHLLTNTLLNSLNKHVNNGDELQIEVHAYDEDPSNGAGQSFCACV